MPATKTGFKVPRTSPGLGDKAWKAFFTKYGGTDLDDVSGMKKEPVMAELLDWEYVEGKKWKAIYAIEDVGNKEVGLTVHIIAPKRGYIGTVRNVIAPKAGIKDAKKLKMVAQGSIENAKGILERMSGGKAKRGAMSPKRQDYEARIRAMEAPTLRGAPLFDGVKWPKGTQVNKNWTYLQL